MVSEICLAIVCGHIPKGLTRSSRSIVRKTECSVDFALARDSRTGKPCVSFISSFGNFHMNTSGGPFPVSLVEITSKSPKSVPVDVASVLHLISVGYPVVGESRFRVFEKFYNPVIAPPVDFTEPLIKGWISSEGDLIQPDSLSSLLIDFHRGPLEQHETTIYNSNTDAINEFHGETSNCGYIDNLQSSRIRSDRGARHSSYLEL